MNKNKAFHTSLSKKGSGDNYGTAIRNKTARTVDDKINMVNVNPKKSSSKKSPLKHTTVA